MAVGVILRPATNRVVHGADRFFAATASRPVVEFPPDGITQLLPSFLAGLHMRERPSGRLRKRQVLTLDKERFRGAETGFDGSHPLPCFHSDHGSVRFNRFW